MEVKSEQELPTELREFINQLIVPLLVDELLTQMGPLYTARESYYDAEAAEEAASRHAAETGCL
jgi:hypothetical protein